MKKNWNKLKLLIDNDPSFQLPEDLKNAPDHVLEDFVKRMAPVCKDIEKRFGNKAGGALLPWRVGKVLNVIKDRFDRGIWTLHNS